MIKGYKLRHYGGLRGLIFPLTAAYLLTIRFSGLKRGSRNFNRWIIYTILSIVVGFGSGFALGIMWFLFSLVILGYGDSGPSWINTISNAALIMPPIISVIVGQLLFIKHTKKSL